MVLVNIRNRPTKNFRHNIWFYGRARSREQIKYQKRELKEMGQNESAKEFAHTLRRTMKLTNKSLYFNAPIKNEFLSAQT